MARLVIAVTAAVGLTIFPAAYRWQMRSQTPADFSALASKLDRLELCPDRWNVTEENRFQFDRRWRERLELRHHRGAVLTGPEGRRLVVLLMLSEMGEQLYHTPAICYAAHGCEVSGEERSLSLTEAGGNVRTVEVVFDDVLAPQTQTVGHSYWVDSQWYSPPQSRILNRMGRQPFLLKLQVLVENAAPDDPATDRLIDSYLAYLGAQLKALEVSEG